MNDGEKLKALIVDDEPDVLRIGEVSLGRIARWDVLCASTSEMALTLAARERPDVVLLDLMLPGVDGRAILTRLKQAVGTADIPVIMMTAGGTHEQTRACLALGAAGIIEKPFDPFELPAKILSIVGGARR